MRMLRHLVAWLRRGRLDDELREELAQHAAWKADQLVADGLSRRTKRAGAPPSRCGNATRLREDSRAVWGFPPLDSVAQDIRLRLPPDAARARHSRTVAVLSLAIGIGAGTAVFSLADARAARGRWRCEDPVEPVHRQAGRSGPVFPFTSLSGYGGQTAAGTRAAPRSRSPRYRSVSPRAGARARRARVRRSVSGRRRDRRPRPSWPRHTRCRATTSTSLASRRQMGRPLGAGDDRSTRAPAAVVSDRFWRRRLDGQSRRRSAGRSRSTACAFTIVGVAPKRRSMAAGQVGTDPDMFVPLAL